MNIPTRLMEWWLEDLNSVWRVACTTQCLVFCMLNNWLVRYKMGGVVGGLERSSLCFSSCIPYLSLLWAQWSPQSCYLFMLWYHQIRFCWYEWIIHQSYPILLLLSCNFLKISSSPGWPFERWRILWPSSVFHRLGCQRRLHHGGSEAHHHLSPNSQGASYEVGGLTQPLASYITLVYIQRSYFLEW